MNLLITGAGSGIGRAAAIALSKDMHIITADLNMERASGVAAEIGGQGNKATAVEVNVTKRDSVNRMVELVQQQVGPIHALFNCAGIDYTKPFAEIGESDWDLMMDTHVKGTFLCSQAILPQMCERKKGVIVNMSSDYAVMGMYGGTAYASAKTAVYSLTKSLALEFAPYGVRVNALGPGPIDTPLLRDGRSGEEWARAQEVFFQKIPMKRLGLPEEVASVLGFLISDRSSYITGQIIHPNGGQLSW